jgi:hypothetical protein
MGAHSNLGTRPPGEERAGLLLVPTSSPDQGAGDVAANEHSRPLRTDRPMWKQFLEHLMHALGGWPV